MSIYHRLLIPELLPPSYSKAIYLDSDVIVRGNLEELWDIEIGEHHLLAVQDLYINYVSSPGGLKNYKELGGVYDSKFFNAGVLVIHLDKWRADNIGSQVIEYAKKMSINDQDSLNSILLGRWGQLDPRWNQIAYIHTYKSWPENSFKHEIEPLYKDLVYNSYIIHFTSSKKPWKLGCKHPQRNLFFKYLGMTRWSNLLPFYYFRYFFEFCEHCLWKLRKIIYKKESKV